MKLSELETEIDYAFTPVCFETIFRNKLLDEPFRAELLVFKKDTDDIPSIFNISFKIYKTLTYISSQVTFYKTGYQIEWKSK